MDSSAFVISLDFELHWGVFDHATVDGPYRANLLGARRAIVEILQLFRAEQIAATWATVGLLFARTKAEAQSFYPTVRPRYSDAGLDPYQVHTGDDEQDDPFHYGASLVAAIQETPGQEIGTHTFAHFYCQETGQTSEAFADDLRSAIRIASTRNLELRSIVFPRNQHNPGYDAVLRENGIQCYRGNPSAFLYQADSSELQRSALRRSGRLLDSYWSISGHQTISWKSLVTKTGLSNVPASAFLRPCNPRLKLLEWLRLRRIVGSMEFAARHGKIYHLWWHPHNFGRYTAENMLFLKQILSAYQRLNRRHGMQSMSMIDVDRAARTKMDAA